MYPENKDKADFLNITKYHDAGFKGQGIKIAVYDIGFNMENHKNQFKNVYPLRTPSTALTEWTFRNGNKNDHGMAVLDIIRQIAPEAEIYFQNQGGFNFFLRTVENRGDIDIVNISMSNDSTLPDFVDDMSQVMLTSAGNDRMDGVARNPATHKNFIAVGSSTEYGDSFKRSKYSTVDDHVEVTSLSSWYVKGLREREFRGTSGTSPIIAGMMALFMSANRKIDREEARHLIRGNVIDLYDEGRDAKTGYGLFILPDQIPYKDFKETKVKRKGDVIMPDFTDIENHWARHSIERIAKMGYVRGYEDGTYRPNETVTRAELAVILDRFIQDQK